MLRSHFVTAFISVVFLLMKQVVLAQTTTAATQPAYNLPATGKRLEMRKRLNVDLSRDLAAIDLRGSVVDTDGAYLSGATISVDQAYTDAFYPKYVKADDQSSVIAKDGHFEVQADLLRHIAAYIRVHKDGFYDETFTLTDGTQINGPNDLLADAFEHGYLEYESPPGNGLIVHLRRIGRVSKLDALFRHEDFVEIETTVDGATVAADPKLETATITFAAPNAPGLKPGAFRIITESQEGKVVGARLTAGDPAIEFQWSYPEDLKRPLLSLSTAPSEGYDSSLRIGPGYGYVSYGEHWFYCKIGQKYGRGEFKTLDVSPDAKTISAKLQIWLQPDGSRNLETGQER